LVQANSKLLFGIPSVVYEVEFGMANCN